jgi:predicted metal-dependent phosphoesterase TrpH
MKQDLEGSRDSRGRRMDLHIHSKYSGDGVLDPEEIVRVAKKKGLDGIAITDHNTIKGGQEAQRYETADFKVILGAEILTDRGEITGLFLSKEIESRHLEDVIKEIKAQGGIVVVPHPFDGLRRSAFSITEEYTGLVDAIEVFNSRCVLGRYNRRALEFAARYGLPTIGGSDAHYASEIGLAGVVTPSHDIRIAILQRDLELFGKRSPLLNHVRTKVRKIWRKATKRAQ